jgi:hypothetical protein
MRMQYAVRLAAQLLVKFGSRACPSRPPAHAQVRGTQVPCVDNCTRTTGKSYNCHRCRTCCEMQGKQLPQAYRCSQHKVNRG